MTVRLASCSCGQLRAEVLGEPVGVTVCHCYVCQRRTGSVFSAQASFPRESVAVEGDGTQFVRVGDEGGRFRFTFCPRCGSTVFYVEEGYEQEISIPLGAFADARFPPPTVSVYEERRHRWVSLPEDVEKHSVIKGHKPQSATSVVSDWKRLGFGSRKVHGRKVYTGVEVDPEWIGAQDDYPMTRR